MTYADIAIRIIKLDGSTYEVTVNANTQTVHIVSFQPSYVQKLTEGKISDEALIRTSFEFLLAREPNTSILRSFDLSVIERYFPEYQTEIKRLL